MTALFNVMETVQFCRRYFKINNSTVKEHYLTKFCGSSEYIFRIQCTKFCRNSLRFGISIKCCLWFTYFLGHSVSCIVIYQRLHQRDIHTNSHVAIANASCVNKAVDRSQRHKKSNWLKLFSDYRIECGEGVDAGYSL